MDFTLMVYRSIPERRRAIVNFLTNIYINSKFAMATILILLVPGRQRRHGLLEMRTGAARVAGGFPITSSSRPVIIG
jgi:hypothetical protein